jgi:hypothetical protein
MADITTPFWQQGAAPWTHEPGQPETTPEPEPTHYSGDWRPEVESHEQWRRRQIREGQRYRRRHDRRFDY